MTLSTKQKADLAELVLALSTGDYAKISAKAWLGRTTVDDLKRVISEYGNTLTSPPNNFLDFSDAFALDNNFAMLIDIPLWTKEEGRSDLMVSVEINLAKKTISINDLRVP